MYILMISRSTLYSSPGGDTVQVVNTAKYLKSLGVQVDIKLTNEIINYNKYDLIHFFNIIRPADILFHISKTNLPYVVSPIFVEFDNVEKLNRGIRYFLYKIFGTDGIEYLKSIGRWVKNNEKIVSLNYLLLGHRNALINVVEKASLLLPNSNSEMTRLEKKYNIIHDYMIIPNAIDKNVFDNNVKHNSKYFNSVICVGQITPRKNQLNIIRALNKSDFNVFIIGQPSKNAMKYYKRCKDEAEDNIVFINHLDHVELAEVYKSAKVHILASWFETTGLVSLEAAVMGCNIVVTDTGDQKEYFKDYATYCVPDSILSIKEAVTIAYHKMYDDKFRDYIFKNYTWEITAQKTLNSYQKVLK